VIVTLDELSKTKQIVWILRRAIGSGKKVLHHSDHNEHDSTFSCYSSGETSSNCGYLSSPTSEVVSCFVTGRGTVNNAQ